MIEVHEYLLCNFEDNSTLAESNENLWNCNWKPLIQTNFIKNFLDNNLKFTVVNDIKLNTDDILLSGVACILAFVQDNFTGPDIKESIDDILGTQWPNQINAIDLLSIDSEELNSNVRKPELLLISKVIFETLSVEFDYNFITQWWLLRYYMIHQQILDETTNSLYTKFVDLSTILIDTKDTIEDPKLQSLLMLEIIQGFMMFRRVVNAEETMNKLIELLGVDLHVEGVLGLRTKFQTKALPQLALKVKFIESFETTSANASHGSTVLPKLLRLDDDVRLEKVEFIEKEENTTMQLSSLIQCVVSTKVALIQLAQPKDKLANEELEPYISSLLNQNHGPLSTRLATLLMLTKLDSTHKRTVDRSLKQAEQLVQNINEDKLPVRHRISYFFTSTMSTRWEIETELCRIMVSLGLSKTALDIYLRLQMWEDVIECYTRLELRHKAAEIIQQEIDKSPSVKLWCLLGDATDDESYYEKAWILSNYRSGVAQRHWGNFFFAKKNFKEAIPHLQKSLEINSLQEILWLRLGFAALSIENWEIAAFAYRRYTNLEPHGFESWNNLAKAYIKLGDKKRAHKIFSEALKCNYNNWKVWENYLFVSIDTGNFEDAINSYNRLNELKSKYYDKQVLEIIVNAVANDIPDANGVPASRLLKKIQTLVAHICVQQPLEGKIWELAAKLYNNDLLIKIDKLQKAYRGYTQSALSWSKDPKQCEQVIRLCLELGNVSLEATENFKEIEKANLISQLSAARMSCQGCLRVATTEKWPNCDEFIAPLENTLEGLTASILKFRGN